MSSDERSIEHYLRRAAQALHNEEVLSVAVIEATRRLVDISETLQDKQTIESVNSVCKIMLAALDETTGKTEKIDSENA